MKREAKVVWLSDIHYCHDDTKFTTLFGANKEKLRKVDMYYDSLATQIKNIKPTHIVISGDLSFSGKYAQLVSFHEKVLSPYLDSGKDGDEVDCLIVVCPGNHDFNRSAFVQLKEAYFKSGISIQSYEEKNQFLRATDKLKSDAIDETQWNGIMQHLDAPADLRSKRGSKESIGMYEICFYDFIKYFKNYIKPTYSKFESNDLEYFNSSEHLEGLCGLLIDHRFGLNFILCNSAWYSWGEKTYEELIVDYMLPSMYNEYGNLTTNKVSIEGIFSHMRNTSYHNVKSEYINILAIHHSLSWIAYEEIHEDSHFIKLLRGMDILLCGHIHVPHYEPSKFRNQTWLFEAPQILDYHIYGPQSDGGNAKLNSLGKDLGFSKFSFSPYKNHIYQSRYTLSSSDSGVSPFSLMDDATPKWKILETDTSGDKLYRIENKQMISSLFDLNRDWSSRLAMKSSIYDENVIESAGFFSLDTVGIDLSGLVKEYFKLGDTELIVDVNALHTERDIYIMLPLERDWLNRIQLSIDRALNIGERANHIWENIHILATDFHFKHLQKSERPTDLMSASKMLKRIMVIMKLNFFREGSYRGAIGYNLLHLRDYIPFLYKGTP